MLAFLKPEYEISTVYVYVYRHKAEGNAYSDKSLWQRRSPGRP